MFQILFGCRRSFGGPTTKGPYKFFATFGSRPLGMGANYSGGFFDMAERVGAPPGVQASHGSKYSND